NPLGISLGGEAADLDLAPRHPGALQPPHLAAEIRQGLAFLVIGGNRDDRQSVTEAAEQCRDTGSERFTEQIPQRGIDAGDRLHALDFHGPMLQDDRRRVPIIGRSGGAAYPFRAPSRCASLAPCPVRSLPAPSLRLRIRDAAPGTIEGMMPLRSTAAARAQKRWGAAMAMLLLAACLAGLGPAQAGDFIDSAGRRVLLPEPIERVMPANPTAEVLVFVLAPQRLVGA